MDASMNKYDWTSTTTIVKFVKWRTNGDSTYELYRYSNGDDSISIPTHPHNFLFQEIYDKIESKSPYKIVFRYIGTNPESGETCRTFNHYSSVNCVDFTRRFTNVQSLFRVCAQLPAVESMLVSFNHENLLVSKDEANQLYNNGVKNYNCASLKRLTIVIAKWDNMDAVALVPYEKLRFNNIINYTKSCCPNIENIRVINEEDDPTSSCFKTLKLFREILIEKFLDVPISWEPTKKKQPLSKEKKEYVPQNHESFAYVKKQKDHPESTLAPPTASPSISGGNIKEEQHSAQLQFPSTAESASNAMTVCTEPIHSVADIKQEDNEFNDCDVYDYAGQRERTSSTVRDSKFIRHHNADKRTPPMQRYNDVASYEIRFTPGQNCFGKGRGRGQQKRNQRNEYFDYTRRKNDWRY